MRERLVTWASGVGFLRLALITIVAIISIWAAYVVIHRLFFAPQEAKKAEATIVVAKEQAKAEEVITTETLNTMRESQVVRTEVQRKVSKARGKVNVEVDRPRTVGRPATEVAVHRAGELALCELHNSFCGDAGSAEVQQVHGAVPGRDSSR